MNKVNVPIFTLTTEEFSELLIQSIKKAGIDTMQKQNEDILLSLKDVMQVFKKSRSSIFAWKKKGILKPFYVAGSLYFKKSEIEKVINNK
ncbi:MAG: hypothetical protein Q8T03_02790 [Bacteroidota bacterium]|nr:hypothetical protein [Bacteroidota bacterium]